MLRKTQIEQVEKQGDPGPWDPTALELPLLPAEKAVATIP